MYYQEGIGSGRRICASPGQIPLTSDNPLDKYR